MAPDFRRRDPRLERMDIEELSYPDFRDCLRDLERVNRRVRAYPPTLAFLASLWARGRPSGRPLSVLDVGSGHGDVLRCVARWAERRGIAVELTGIDSNPWSARAAREATPPSLAIDWVTANVFDYRPARPPDVVLSSLFTHHLDDGEVVRFLRWMEAHAARGWFINDLHRHPLPYHVFGLLARVARSHRFVQHDGPLSIARAFTRADWQALLRDAGVEARSVRIEWCWPFRLTVGRIRAT